MTLKKNKVHQGDCVKQLAKLDEGSVDLVFADPPFNIGYDYDVYDDDQNEQDYLGWCDEWIQGVHRALKPDGTFWLAIGDEYAAELKIASQKAGFHCRSWVIWYYTFGVNCKNGFSRSHTHVFHFVKNPKKFTFVRPNPNIRVKSARQLVYADNRANPAGRLPDNTWITRPQDAPESFRTNHDTWFFSRVAGTFKEREGFHGCQMPEQLLARIIRASSKPHDLVLDPFGGSGTTLCVAKKLNRNWMGFELSKEYVQHINKRLDQTNPGDAIDGPEDPIESAPQTSKGKQRVPKPFDEKTIEAVIESYEVEGDGFSPDYILCDKDLNKRFVKGCLKRGTKGNATVWNRFLLELRDAGKLPEPTKQPPQITAAELNRYAYAGEIAWRLIADEFGSDFQPAPTLDQILSCPDSALFFDQIAQEYGPQDRKVTSLEYRQAALNVREMARDAQAEESYSDWSGEELISIEPADLNGLEAPTFETAGVFLVMSQGVPIYAGEAENLREHLTAILSNPAWEAKFDPDAILLIQNDKNLSENCALKSALARKYSPMLNCKVWLLDKSTAQAAPVSMA